MSIRESEDRLFNEWQKKYAESSFVTDGCPNPNVYESEIRKVVFVLKDGNLGEPNLSETFDKRHYDQRKELEIAPDTWWSTIAQWCFFLKKPNASWKDSQIAINNQESIKVALSHHCFIQLKKAWGGGSVSNNSLEEFANRDTHEIISQLSIYTPNFIIACGTGDQLSNIFNYSSHKQQETSAGIRYFDIELNGFPCYLIDYCHPSIRVGTKVKGLIAQGLAHAILEIERNA